MKSKYPKDGEKVRIIKPLLVTRVGYPKCLSDYREPALAKLKEVGLIQSPNLTLDRMSRGNRRLVDALAFKMCGEDHFGGKTRSIHTEEEPKLAGEIVTVRGLRRVMTGEYYPPYSYYSNTWDGIDYDYEPGGLSNAKQHTLVQFWAPYNILCQLDRPLEIESCNVEWPVKESDV